MCCFLPLEFAEFFKRARARGKFTQNRNAGLWSVGALHDDNSKTAVKSEKGRERERERAPGASVIARKHSSASCRSCPNGHEVPAASVILPRPRGSRCDRTVRHTGLPVAPIAMPLAATRAAAQRRAATRPRITLRGPQQPLPQLPLVRGCAWRAKGCDPPRPVAWRG